MNGCDVDDRMNKHLQLYNNSYIEAFEGTSRDKNSALKCICCFFLMLPRAAVTGTGKIHYNLDL